jgi:hypothetical protein
MHNIDIANLANAAAIDLDNLSLARIDHKKMEKVHSLIAWFDEELLKDVDNPDIQYVQKLANAYEKAGRPSFKRYHVIVVAKKLREEVVDALQAFYEGAKTLEKDKEELEFLRSFMNEVSKQF